MAGRNDAAIAAALEVVAQAVGQQPKLVLVMMELGCWRRS